MNADPTITAHWHAMRALWRRALRALAAARSALLRLAVRPPCRAPALPCARLAVRPPYLKPAMPRACRAVRPARWMKAATSRGKSYLWHTRRTGVE